MKLFGLIGYPLSHSFSKRYFTEKFEKENISNCKYELFEIASCDAMLKIIATYPDLVGLNVTIPYKQQVLEYIDELDATSAARIGAVNTIKILPNRKLIGYNTDYYGFRNSLKKWLSVERTPLLQALILGNGGAAKAVEIALEDLLIPFLKVVRQANVPNTIQYEDLTSEIINSYRLIINTTPVGTYPHIDECPAIPYHLLTSQHFLYDLVYNPAETLFLKKGNAQGAKTHNGLLMLHLQADKAWEIWNS